MLDNWLSIMALLLAYGSLLLCRCRRKIGSVNAVMLLALMASIIPVFLSARSAVIVLASFSLIIFGYFEVYYERRLRTLGRVANGMAELPEQTRLLLFFADKIAEQLCWVNFRFYSEHTGLAAFLAFAAHPGSFASKREINMALCHALQFVYGNATEKWGISFRSYSVSLLLEQINRNAFLYLMASRAGIMADIRNVARQNLYYLLNIYYRNFYLQEGNSADWKSAEAFAELRQQFEAELVKFPIQIGLA